LKLAQLQKKEEKMKLQKSLLSGIMFVVGGVSALYCGAQDVPKSDNAAKELCAPFEMKAATEKKIIFDVPQFGEGQQVRLQLEVCTAGEAGAGAGSNPVMGLLVNGSKVLGRHLVNKSVNINYNGTTKMSIIDGALWRVLYASDFEIIPDFATQFPDDPNPYLFIFDITKLVKAGEKNELVIKYNNLLPDYELKARDIKLTIDDKIMKAKAK
jgi:hypothetical protein